MLRKLSQILVVVFCVIAFSSSSVFVLAANSSAELEKEMAAFNAQSKEYSKQANTKRQKIQGDLKSISAKLNNSKNEADRKTLKTEIKSLKEALNRVNEELASHDIEVAKKRISANQERLRLAEERLAKIRANKS